MTPNLIRETVRQRLEHLRARIKQACARAGRPSDAVRLVGVTKTVDTNVAALLPELGVEDLGESRPQELWRKRDAMRAPVRWHLVGHLQTNKVARTLPVHLIHSVDSTRLLDFVDREVASRGGSQDILLQVNASREPNKHGFAPKDLVEIVARSADLSAVRVVGLMTMAALGARPDECRQTFAVLSRLQRELSGSLPAPHSFERLSMGMSDDFEIAIEQGATDIRIGSTLFANLLP
jgi:pyridoxal phosphate enzyme (YggS family)